MAETQLLRESYGAHRRVMTITLLILQGIESGSSIIDISAVGQMLNSNVELSVAHSVTILTVGDDWAVVVLNACTVEGVAKGQHALHSTGEGRWRVCHCLQTWSETKLNCHPTRAYVSNDHSALRIARDENPAVGARVDR